MWEDFHPRHIPPLLLATTAAIGGLYPFFNGGEAALLKFGFPQHIAASKAAYPVITAFSSRTSAIGIALWIMYLGGHYQAMDILIASMGWIAIVDGWVCLKDGAPGSASFRATTTGVAALWGMLGMTTGKWI